MKIIIKKLLLLAILPAILVGTLSGCAGSMAIYSGYHELDQLEIVKTVCIDSGESGVLVTVGTGIGQKDAEPRIFRQEAETISLALSKLRETTTGKEAVFSHTQHIVIGEEAAMAGIKQYLDFFARSVDIRFDTNIFVIQGKADDAITKTASKSTATSEMLMNIEEEGGKTELGKVSTCREVITNIERNNTAVIYAIKSQDTDEISGDTGEQKIFPAGCAIIKDDLLAGYAEGEEACGLAMVMGKDVTDEVNIDGTILKLMDVKMQFKPSYVENKLMSVTLIAEMAGDITEVTNKAQISDEAVRQEIKTKAEELVISRITAAIAHSQELGADYLNIGKHVEMKNPVKFSPYTKTWEDIYPKMNFDIQANITIKRTFDIVNPIT